MINFAIKMIFLFCDFVFRNMIKNWTSTEVAEMNEWMPDIYTIKNANRQF